MEGTKEQDAPPAGKALFITDRELAPMLGVSVAFLQKDRRGAQRIPFVRLGDRCLYDPAEALAAVRALAVGGPRGRRGRATSRVPA